MAVPGFKLVKQVSMDDFGGGLNSVSVANGVVAVAVEADPKTDPGSIVFLNTAGDHLSTVAAGSLPDMVTFTPDRTKVVTANEGEPDGEDCRPDGEGFANDPEGSVTVVDFGAPVTEAAAASLTNDDTKTASFPKFNDQADDLRAKGVRIFSPGATAAQDFEPEFVAVSDDSTTAYVTLQENNAIAVIDLASAEVTKLLPLGTVDYSLATNAIDPSDKDDKFELRPVPVKGMFLPDAIATFVAGGSTYLATANEGVSRDYDCFSEEVRLGDPADDGGLEFPADSELATRTADEADLGRLLATNAFPYSADAPESVYAFGARSFSIWDTSGTLIWDSAADLTQRVLDDPVLGAGFQGQDAFEDETENWTGWEADSRSDDKGIEPEAVTIGTICGVPNAFIGFERQSAVAQYDISDPSSPKFVRFISSANYEWTGTEAGDKVIDPETAGDISPEGVIFIPADQSPTGDPLLVAAHELSGSTAAWTLPSTCDSAPSAATTAEGGSAAESIEATTASAVTASSTPASSDTSGESATSSEALSPTDDSGQLAHTGRNTGWLLFGGVLVVGLGAVLIVARRDKTSVVGDEI